MAIEFTFDPEQNQLAIHGRLTIHHAAEALEYLRDLHDLALNLEAVEEIDGAGLQLLMAVRRDAGMRLLAASETVRDTLHLAGLDDLLEGRA